jgi:hypothetical protein
MKLNILRKYENRIWLSLLFATALGGLLLTTAGSRGAPVLLANASANAVPAPSPVPWTALGSTGAVDEAALNIYAFNGSEIGFKAGAAGTLVTARYNVTNTYDNNSAPNKPGWHTLEMGSTAPINTIVEAKLFQVKACDPTPVLLCTARNRSMDTPCARCTINGTIDFTDHLYFVEVTLNRPSATATPPRMHTLRIF